MKLIQVVIISVLTSMTFASCQDKVSDCHKTENSVYYWRTVLELDSLERNFLRENNIGRVYLRFFDIVVDKSPLAMDVVVPNATLHVKDSMPVKDIVPTIYITVDAIKEMQGKEAMWAEKIVKRIYNMCSYNELPEPKEVQLDCDWDAHTESIFFNLCKEVKKELLLRNPESRISATIRLHQLSHTPPPVDYGVLMLYNTGSFQKSEETNSILTVESVKPYLKHLGRYPLYLDYALPIFTWNLVYQNERFRGILNSNVSLSENIVKFIGEDRYEVVNDTMVHGIYLYKGTIIRREEVSFQTIMAVRKLIDEEMDNEPRSIILYSLDSKNISNYSENEIKQIYM